LGLDLFPRDLGDGKLRMQVGYKLGTVSAERPR
ncbi:unnamed protein product, partial [Urochloa humidicola]